MLVSEKAYILYCKPYKETSAILRLLTNTQGMLSGIIKGVYGNSKSSASLRSRLQIGNLIEFQWQGKSSLKNIYQVELCSSTNLVSPQKFVCLSYVNELLLYFLQEQHAIDNVFGDYHNFIQSLSIEESLEPVLRCFEYDLLNHLGYSIDFTYDANAQETINKHSYYTVVPDAGLRLSAQINEHCYLGSDLLMLQNRDFSDARILAMAKRINRQLLGFYMEGKPIKSRQLYKEMFNS